MPCLLFIESSTVTLRELCQTLTVRGTFEDHNKVVRVVLPVQEPNDLWHAVTFIRQDGEGDLIRKGVWMIRLQYKPFLSSLDSFPSRDLSLKYEMF